VIDSGWAAAVWLMACSPGRRGGGGVLCPCRQAAGAAPWEARRQSPPPPDHPWRAFAGSRYPDPTLSGDLRGVRAWYRNATPGTSGDRPRALLVVRPDQARAGRTAGGERTCASFSLSAWIFLAHVCYPPGNVRREILRQDGESVLNAELDGAAVLRTATTRSAPVDQRNPAEVVLVVVGARAPDRMKCTILVDVARLDAVDSVWHMSMFPQMSRAW
jgi:hypothetical protein